MERNDIVELREHLFDAIRRLKSNEMRVEQAKAICEVAQTIINSAKVEVQYLAELGQESTSSFMVTQDRRHALPAASDRYPRRGLSTGKNLGSEEIK